MCSSCRDKFRKKDKIFFFWTRRKLTHKSKHISFSIFVWIVLHLYLTYISELPFYLDPAMASTAPTFPPTSSIKHFTRSQTLPSIPNHYKLPTQLDPNIISSATIPTVDISVLTSGSTVQRSQAVRELGEACRNWGFFQVSLCQSLILLFLSSSYPKDINPILRFIIFI